MSQKWRSWEYEGQAEVPATCECGSEIKIPSDGRPNGGRGLYAADYRTEVAGRDWDGGSIRMIPAGNALSNMPRGVHRAQTPKNQWRHKNEGGRTWVAWLAPKSNSHPQMMHDTAPNSGRRCIEKVCFPCWGKCLLLHRKTHQRTKEETKRREARSFPLSLLLLALRSIHERES